MSQTLEPTRRSTSVAAPRRAPRWAQRLLDGLGLDRRLGFAGVAEPAFPAPPLKRSWQDGLLLGRALSALARGEAPAADAALRVLAISANSPIAERLLPEAARMAEGGARVAILLAEEPRAAEQIDALAAAYRALGRPPLERFLRIARFPGSLEYLEQAMIGDRACWTGAPLGAPRPTALDEGALIDLTAAEDAPAAARLRFAAAWRLSVTPSSALERRVEAAGG